MPPEKQNWCWFSQSSSKSSNRAFYFPLNDPMKLLRPRLFLPQLCHLQDGDDAPASASDKRHRDERSRPALRPHREGRLEFEHQPAPIPTLCRQRVFCTALAVCDSASHPDLRDTSQLACTSSEPAWSWHFICVMAKIISYSNPRCLWKFI